MTVAKTIQAQLGGALVMLGAKHLVDIGDGLQFKVQGSAKGNTVVIRLEPSTAPDFYAVELWKVGGTDVQKVRTRRGVHVAELKNTITSLTGLLTKL